MASAVRALRDAGCETPRLDAEILAAHALGVERAALVLRDDAAVPAALLERRLRREPVAYITGRKGFRRIELKVDERVLIPRPDTETLVEVALRCAGRGARVHDVGTGSGAVALALKDERPDLVVTASDVSPGAVAVARANAERLGLDVAVFEADGLPPGGYDLAVANLPYVRADEWDGLAPEIRLYEPRGALVGGADGLDPIRTFVSAAAPGTLLALEHAPDQAEPVRALLDDASTERDLAGRERVTLGRAR